jgi:large subunit ribosomal protein L10
MPHPMKLEYVEKIKKDLKGLNGIVLADFKGLSVHDQEDLRNKVDKMGGSAKVIKNTLLRKAFEASKIEGLEVFLKNNTIMFSSRDDIIQLLKVISDFSKHHDKFTLKGGFFEGKVFDREGIIAMAQLPSRQELMGRIVGGLDSMISGFVGILNGIMTQFIGTLEAIEKKKGV